MTMWIETSVDRRGSEGKCKNAARLIKRNETGLLQIDGLRVPGESQWFECSSGGNTLASRLTTAATRKQKMGFGNMGC